MPREAFIPLRPADLVHKLADEPAVTIFEREKFRQLCQLVEATIHHEYRSRLDELKSAYEPFDPDEDRPLQYQLGPRERMARCRRLFDRFDALLTRANYRRLSRDELEAAIRAPSDTGLRLHLDLDLFERVEIYVRGECSLPMTRRSWRTLWRTEKATVPTHRRLALIFRLARRSPLTEPLDEQAVVLKLFKNIPQRDVETLLPGGAIRLGWLEQAKIVVPTVSGVGLTLFKLLEGASAFAFASLYGLLAFAGLVSGALGYGIRSFYSYLHTREKYQLSLTRQLYFQNLDNNAGVLFHLLNEAEEQEFREVVLAWWLLWRGGQTNAKPRELDQAAERWLRERCGIEVNFEIGDALAKLRRYGLARESASGRWVAADIDEALATLDRAWDQQFDYQRPTAPEDKTVEKPRIWRAAA
ncbi:MAG: DUF3754 domain-containing protein [Pirellulaceae bacterium]|nr:DUF3754 domain-containing protein [Pirellulaceae bacterium]